MANWGKEEVANWGKGEMPLCSRTQWNFESLADQTSEILCWRFQFCAQLTPSNEKYWQKGTRKFYSQAIWPSFSRPSTQEGRGTWLGIVQLYNLNYWVTHMGMTWPQVWQAPQQTQLATGIWPNCGDWVGARKVGRKQGWVKMWGEGAGPCARVWEDVGLAPVWEFLSVRN